MSGGATKEIETYRLAARPMALGDIEALHALSIGVRWPHRPEDWAMLIRAGHGVVAEDEIGRVVGCAMWWPLGEGLVSVGMVITTPRLQEQGAARWLMAQIEPEIAGQDRVLSATRAAYRLYLSLGFRPGATVWQHQGIVVEAPAPVPGARAMEPGDGEAVRMLDAQALGASRRAVMDELLAISEGTVIERDGRVVGFALCRPFGRGHVVGPVVAEREADAVALVAPHVAARAGRFLRLDTREEEGPLRSYLTAAGMLFYDTVTSMAAGRERPATGPGRTFALASQALG
ncbi:MAG: GNAT family N-acetyltransferase [Amaricoccus sp.]